MAEAINTTAPSIDSRIEEARCALKRSWALTALNGKKPKLRSWQSQPHANLSQVIKWITRHHNLGLRTGTVSGIIVIDDDSVDGSASTALNLPKTVTVITGSGKRHFYFQAPDFKVGNSCKTIAPDIDVRGDGGQVVYVGSVHPATGRAYEWAPGLSPEDVAVADLPTNVADLLRANRVKPKTAAKLKLVEPAQVIEGESELMGSKRIESYAKAALDAELDNVHASIEGNRNDTLNKSAFALGQLVGAGALDQHHVRGELLAAAVAVGLGETEADATINSGLDAGAKEPRDLGSITSSEANAEASNPGGDEDPRPKIKVYSGWLHTIVTKAERVLLRQVPAIYYQRGTTMVRILALPEAGAGRSITTKPMIFEVTSVALVDKLTELIRWEKLDKRSSEVYAVDCPERVALTLLARSGAWRLPPLIGVIDCPTLRSDGAVLEREGYDRGSGLYLSLGNAKWPSIPAWPTIDDARAALEKLRWLLKDFPFVAPSDESVALAAILTPLIRPSLRTAPLFAFRAAKMGSGKSLLADVVSMISTGRAAAVMSQGLDENEDKKRMLAILAEGDPVAVIDNIERPFGGAALCSILTQSTWRDRLLGKSQTLTLPTTNTTWLATGNNIVFVGDITTRVLICDLDPKCERPEERKFDINLHHYIAQHRGELVVAGLTILRAYHVAQRPDQQLPVFGRFEEWSDWVRSALVWLGLADPCETRRRAEETDPVRAELTGLLVALRTHFDAKSFRVADVLAAKDDDDAIHEAVSSILGSAGTGQSHAQFLGLFFAKVNRRPEGGLRLVRGNLRGGSNLWQVERV